MPTFTYLREQTETRRTIAVASNKDEAERMFFHMDREGKGPSTTQCTTVVTRLSKRDGSRWQKFMDLLTGRISLDEIDGDSYNVAFERDK